MKNSRLLAFAQLLRLPNVFTSLADIALAAAATGAIHEAPIAVLIAACASACLYLSGMVWNDVFDRAADTRTRSHRPIPSGRITVRTAVILGTILTALGLGFGLLLAQVAPGNGWHDPAAITLVLAVMILLYDAKLKHTSLGPLAMGSCRSLNVLLGLSAVGSGELVPNAQALHLAGAVGLYIAGVTWFAKTEELTSDQRQLKLAGFVMLGGVLAGLLIPMRLPEGQSPWYFPYLITGFIFIVGSPVVRAIARPEPRRVQTAVVRAVHGLVVFDAVLATAFVGWTGLLILGLLIPIRLLARRVYST